MSLIWRGQAEVDLAEARATVRTLEAEITRLERALEREKDERTRLTDVIVEMKREGFLPPPQQQERKEREEIDARLLRAVEAKARPGEPLYAELMQHATLLLRDGTVIDDVIRDIERGGAYPDEEE